LACDSPAARGATDDGGARIGDHETGRPYENRYCVMINVVDGKLREIIDYVDTELLTNVLIS
jgi:ketosteroid isomerase-like protein